MRLRAFLLKIRIPTDRKGEEEKEGEYVSKDSLEKMSQDEIHQLCMKHEILIEGKTRKKLIRKLYIHLNLFALDLRKVDVQEREKHLRCKGSIILYAIISAGRRDLQ